MMRSTLAASGVLAFATVALSGQTQPSLTAPAKADPGPTVTITGCLRPWDATTMSAEADSSRRLPGAAAAQQFVLTNAQHESGGARAPMAPVPPTTGAAALNAPSTYLLREQSTGVNLASHVNHKVQITGTVALPAASHVGSASPSAAPTIGSSPVAPSARPQPTATSVQPTFTVATLKMLDNMCLQ